MSYGRRCCLSLKISFELRQLKKVWSFCLPTVEPLAALGLLDVLVISRLTSSHQNFFFNILLSKLIWFSEFRRSAKTNTLLPASSRLHTAIISVPQFRQRNATSNWLRHGSWPYSPPLPHLSLTPYRWYLFSCTPSIKGGSMWVTKLSYDMGECWVYKGKKSHCFL